MLDYFEYLLNHPEVFPTEPKMRLFYIGGQPFPQIAEAKNVERIMGTLLVP